MTNHRVVLPMSTSLPTVSLSRPKAPAASPGAPCGLRADPTKVGPAVPESATAGAVGAIFLDRLEVAVWSPSDDRTVDAFAFFNDRGAAPRAERPPTL